MITNKEIYRLHTSVDSEPSELYEAYRDVPLDSLDESRKNNTPLHTACHFADMTAVEIAAYGLPFCRHDCRGDFAGKRCGCQCEKR